MARLEKDSNEGTVTCWSCGQQYQGDRCPKCGDTTKINKYSPREILPICGEENSELDLRVIYGANKETSFEVVCCRCGKEYVVNKVSDWTDGACPNCGASGPDGRKRRD